MRYAEVAVNAAVNQTFHYHIPDELTVRVGHLVRVAFGTAMQQGIVVALHEALPDDLDIEQTKPIQAILDPMPVMSRTYIDLGLWMSERYLTSPGACLWLMLPPGITRNHQRMIALTADAATLDSIDMDTLTPMKRAILDALRDDDELTERQLQRATGYKTVVSAAKEMAGEGWVRVYSRLRPRSVSVKTVRTVQLAIPSDEIDAAHEDLSRAPKQTRVFNYIAQFEHPLDASEVYDAVDATSTDLNNLEERGLIRQSERIDYRDSLADTAFIPVEPPTLTPEQQTVWERIKQGLTADDAHTDNTDTTTFLLHGVTGSGKTEIYLRAIANVLERGQQAIFLVPEIALTPQTIERVARRFPQRVAVVHGSLPKGERYDTWRRARAGDIQVIVGTRSALFTPLPDLGLVILDEEHDSSYKQTPTLAPPYYHARDVAEKLMQLNDGVVILGSATPDIETYHRAQQGELTYLHLPNRIMGHRQQLEAHAEREGVEIQYDSAGDDAMTIELPPVTIVDMRAELKKGNRSMFSHDLQQALTGVLERGEQAMLLLNRRGEATYVFCRDCGYVVECDNCDIPMTYHRHGNTMRCHHCGSRQTIPQTCPACESHRIKYFGAGTQQVEAAVQEMFPQATTVRWDADTVTTDNNHDVILARFASGDTDILIGTQMIAKGLDLPLVTLVGVVSADPGLALPDFRAHERAFQLLTQVAGRAGRGILGGQVIIQTYQPAHESIVAAANHDYDAFYAQEIANRRRIGYPPFRRLARLLVHHTHPVEAERQAERLAQRLQTRIQQQQLTDTHLMGPAPCFFSRIDRYYRWQVLIRSADPLAALRGIDWGGNSSRQDGSVYVDIDPVSVL